MIRSGFRAAAVLVSLAPLLALTAGPGATLASADVDTSPTIVATLTSLQPPIGGWYRRPVTVTFTCTSSRPLTGDGCPAPVTMSTSGRDQAVSGAVTDDQGATATVTRAVSIDRVRPTVTVRGARNGAVYAAARRLTCVAADAHSGVLACTVTTARTRTRAGTVVRWTGRGVDRVGNETITYGRYTIRRL